MMLTSHLAAATRASHRVVAHLHDLPRLLPVILALAVLLAVVVALASTYVGRGSSPYDMCETPNRRPVSCALLHRIAR